MASTSSSTHLVSHSHPNFQTLQPMLCRGHTLSCCIGGGLASSSRYSSCISIKPLPLAKQRRMVCISAVASNVPSGRKGLIKEITMVDPLEAKRLAAMQMEEIRAKEKFKRRQQIEAINGAWAMIGLTAGLVIEGQTGKSILDQLIGYWSAITGVFVR